MNKIDTLIFDLDGTLIDSSDGVVEAVNYSLRMMGENEQGPENIKPFIGFPLSLMYPHFTDKSIRELYQHFQIKAAETVVSSTTVLPGVEEILTALKEKSYKMSIATTKIRNHVDGIIEKFHWQNYFLAYVGGDEIPNVKPAPDAFLEAMKRVASKPENCMVIGDTINDIRAAKSIPIKVAAVLSPYSGIEKLKKTDPDYWLDSIENLPKLLEEL